MALIEDSHARGVSFKKRRQTLLRHGKELAASCRVGTLVVIVGEDGTVKIKSAGTLGTIEFLKPDASEHTLKDIVKRHLRNQKRGGKRKRRHNDN